MGIMSILYTGIKGLTASQLGMDIAGQNITNADVEGYSRKRLNMSADYRWDANYGQMGFGVEVKTIERMRDTYLDQQIRYQQQDVGMYEQLNKTFQTIENIFTEPGDTGLLTYIDNFFDSWENLANNPADVASRTMVKTSGSILCETFHNVSAQLREYRRSRNDEITNRVDRVNELATEIFNLNQEIATVEIGLQKANDSRDQRDQLLKQLSKIIKIDTFENSLGQITVTTGGNILVSPVDIQKLQVSSTGYTRADGSSYSDIGIVYSGSKKAYVPAGGELYGIIQSRDVTIPEFETWLDDLAEGIAEAVNQQHQKGYTLLGYTGIQFFDPDYTGASDVALSPSILSDVKNIAAASGCEDQDAGTNTFAGGLLNFGNTAMYLSKTGGFFAAPPAVGDRAHNIVNKSVVVTVNGVALIEAKDYHIDYVNGTIQMLHNGYDNNQVQVDFKFKTDNFAGPGDNSNAIAIGKLRQRPIMSPDALGNGMATFDQFYSSGIGTIGLYRNEAESNLETRQFLIKQYETSQDSIAGVSLDEEMAELIKYEHTYQAAARIITTVNEMFDTLMKL